MDFRSVFSPTIQDRDAFEDFADALIDRAPLIERDVARLKKQPQDRELTADLFRAIHNIKGDASLCKFDLGIALVHPIESMMSRFRDGELQFSDLLAECVLRDQEFVLFLLLLLFSLPVLLVSLYPRYS